MVDAGLGVLCLHRNRSNWGLLFGFADHIGAEGIIRRPIERQLLAVFELVSNKFGLESGSVLDASANVGNHARFFAQRSQQYCVEPSTVALLFPRSFELVATR